MKINEHPRRHICTLTSSAALAAASAMALGTVGCEETVEPTPPEPRIGQVEMRGDVEEMYTSGAFRFDIEAGPNEGQEVLVIPSTPGLVLEEGAEVDVIASVTEVTQAAFERETGLHWEDNYEDDFTQDEIIVADAVSVAVVD
jgi:hypothetical protein